jgi:starch phosphorylase
MKAAINGVLNCSILDGWWDEAYNPNVGWAIGQGEQYADTNLQDDVESKALYDLLERDIIPLFYQRGRDGLPREWIKRMKSSMKEIGKSMSCQRMLMNYSEQFYYPALKNYRHMIKGDYSEAKSLAAYLVKLRQVWDTLHITHIDSNAKPVMQRGDSLTVTACIELGPLTPDEIQVELYHGAISSKGGYMEQASRSEMRATSHEGTIYHYQVRIECENTGMQGHTIRLLPKHPAMVHPYRTGLIKWA